MAQINNIKKRKMWEGNVNVNIEETENVKKIYYHYTSVDKFENFDKMDKYFKKNYIIHSDNSE